MAFACAQPSQALPLARMLVRRLELSAHPAQLLMDGLPMSSTWAGSSLLTALDLVIG
ncbi:MAG: hypothetical protein JRF33_24255, partial [Deltaproteobacteria bacterium]|nr:hypothetical protein [Deltaproteobacteria bacterium]